MRWALANRADARAIALADRHYSRQTPGAQMMRPGACVVLVSICGRAVWGVTRQEHVDHEWAGAWECTIFRNEGAGLSSELVLEALAATRSCWPDLPSLGCITMVHAAATARRRSRRAGPGACFRHAGFVEVGLTKKRGLTVLLLPAVQLPAAVDPLGFQRLMVV